MSDKVSLVEKSPQAAVIAKSGTTSNEVDIRGLKEIGLIVPLIDSAALTFQVSNVSGGTFRTVKAKDASTALTVTASTGQCAIASDDLKGLVGYSYLKIVAGAAQNTAAVTLYITGKA